MGSSKKKRRSNKEYTPPVKTVDCQSCKQPITIPNKCEHGKKLINCRGSNCGTAHITEHNEACPVKRARSLAQAGRASAKAAATAAVETAKAAGAEMAILHELIEQELNNVEKVRGKKMKYLTGISRDEILKKIEQMDLHHSRLVARMLKDLAEERMTVEQAKYDDEDSDTEVEGCLTPPEEEDEKSEQDLGGETATD